MRRGVLAVAVLSAPLVAPDVASGATQLGTISISSMTVGPAGQSVGGNGDGVVDAPWLRKEPTVQSQPLIADAVLGDVDAGRAPLLRQISLSDALNRLDESAILSDSSRTLDGDPVVEAGLSWSSILGIDEPSQSLSWADVWARRDTPAVRSTPLVALDLSGSPLRRVDLTLLVLGSARLGDLPLRRVDTRSEAFETWCEYIDCAGLTVESTVADVLARGVPLRRVPLESVPLRRVDAGQLSAIVSVPLRRVDVSLATGLASVPLRRVDWVAAAELSALPLRRVDLTTSGLGVLPLSAIDLPHSALGAISVGQLATPNAVTSCVPSCTDATLAELSVEDAILPTATVADLSAVVAGSDDYTVGDLVRSLRESSTVNPTLGELMKGLLDDELTIRDLLPGLPADNQPGDGHYDEQVTLGDLLGGLLGTNDPLAGC